jgi:hypothetical protein
MADEQSTTGDGGVLGNLPHSRPGRRSEKRDAGRGKASAATPPKPTRAVRAEPSAAAPTHRSGGPIGDAVHTATKVAGTGVRVAGAVAHEVLRRLPRP